MAFNANAYELHGGSQGSDSLWVVQVQPIKPLTGKCASNEMPSCHHGVFNSVQVAEPEEVVQPQQQQRAAQHQQEWFDVMEEIAVGGVQPEVADMQVLQRR